MAEGVGPILGGGDFGMARLGAVQQGLERAGGGIAHPGGRQSGSGRPVEQGIQPGLGGVAELAASARSRSMSVSSLESRS